MTTYAGTLTLNGTLHDSLGDIYTIAGSAAVTSRMRLAADGTVTLSTDTVGTETLAILRTDGTATAQTLPINESNYPSTTTLAHFGNLLGPAELPGTGSLVETDSFNADRSILSVSGTASVSTGQYVDIGGSQVYVSVYGSFTLSGPLTALPSQIGLSDTAGIRVTEGNAGTTPMVFAVTRQGDSTDALNVAWSVAGSGAAPANAADFVGNVLPQGTIYFAASETTAYVTINVAGDTQMEPDETFALSLGLAPGNTLLHAPSLTATSVTGTIANDDAAFDLVPVQMTAWEGNATDGSVTFRITLSNARTAPCSVNWSVVGFDSYRANATDFAGGVLPHGFAFFPAGSTSQEFRIGIAADSIPEPDETFAVVLSNPSPGVSLGNTTLAGIIANDDTTISIVADHPSQAEGNGTAIPATFTLTRTGYLGVAQSVDWAVTGLGTYPANAADFIGAALPSGHVTFAAGQATASIAVPVAPDVVAEPDETYTVTLSNPASDLPSVFHLTLGTASATATILTDDPTLSIAATDADKAEGNSGSTPFTFTVTRGGGIGGITTVRWAAGGLNPNTVSALDFAGGVVPAGTLTFAAGETSKTITVNIQGDQLAEQDEHFHVVLLGPSAGTTLIANEAVATVRNDDTNFAIVSTTGSHVEGNSGATPFLFTVTRSGDLSGSNTVGYVMIGAGPNSVGPNDFVGGVGAEGTLSFAPGEVSQVITINVQGDTQLEPNEYFQVALRQPTGGATVPLNTRTALGLIVDDETSFTLAATDAVKTEGNSGATPFTFTVTRGGNIAGTHTAHWLATGLNPNTVSGADFVGGTGPTGTLTFLPGETSKTITINVQGDTLVEPDEHFSVLLNQVSGGATVLVNHASGTILNDDAPPPADLAAPLTQLAAADFTGDGVADLLRQSPTGDLFLLDGAHATQSALSIPTTTARFVAAADLNGDGKADLLLQGGGGALYDWTMDGASVRAVDLLAWLAPTQQVAGITGDGHAGILLHDSAAVAAPWTLLHLHAAPASYATWPPA